MKTQSIPRAAPAALSLDPAGQCVMRDGRPLFTVAPCAGVSSDDVARTLEQLIGQPVPVTGISRTTLVDMREENSPLF